MYQNRAAGELHWEDCYRYTLSSSVSS